MMEGLSDMGYMEVLCGQLAYHDKSTGLPSRGEPNTLLESMRDFPQAGWQPRDLTVSYLHSSAGERYLGDSEAARLNDWLVWPEDQMR